MISRWQLNNVCSSRFLLSTHYTHYNPWVFAVNFSALLFVLFPKLPIVRGLSPIQTGADSFFRSYMENACAFSRMMRLALLLLHLPQEQRLQDRLPFIANHNARARRMRQHILSSVFAWTNFFFTQYYPSHTFKLWPTYRSK